MDFTWLGLQICIFWSRIPITTTRGSEISVSGVITICLMQCDTSPLHRLLLLILACGMSAHSSSMAVWSCWILAGIGTRCRTRWSRASEKCSMGDMSGEQAGCARTGMFSASRNCVQILATWSSALSCFNMRWCWRMNGTTMGLGIWSVHSAVLIVCSLCLPIP